MSHHKQRTETNCLNCGNEVNGLYCSKCGQANVEVKLTFWQTITHFLADLFHYDSKFLLSIKYLITRPGFLANKWFEGKRASYLDPFKMYIFGSAIFFFTLSFVISDTGKNIKINGKEKEINWKYDSLTLYGVKYGGYEDYQKRQDSLPESEKDGGLRKFFNEKSFKLNDTFRLQGSSSINFLIKLYVSTIPYLLFICLPIFAGILKLLYIRRKEYYYSDHGIFTMHLVLFIFIANLILILLNMIPWSVGGLVTFAMTIFIIYHIYKSFKNFYKQSRSKTLVKYILFSVLAFLVLLFAFVAGMILLLVKL
ncbi:DUF3667 domain-containing protein [Gynurincola endophyticus]|uniref:DUF3667 domain-containing protein n=1 Tax=Gynurincola endophyticus TaxID=2479004 RepID=UPI000F8C776A|nr:DUF3667 domain-containing protein [Gynurincola endophyticus]